MASMSFLQSNTQSTVLGTCTVGQVAGRGLGELVDVVVAATLLHLDGGGAEGAALLLPVATHIAFDDAVPPPRVSPCQPQWRVGAAFVHGDTPLGHLQALALVVHAVPAFCRGD